MFRVKLIDLGANFKNKLMAKAPAKFGRKWGIIL